jgi:hypothetical protein
MNFALFDAMSPEEAREHLQGFLATESVATEALTAGAKQGGVLADFSVGSLPSVLRWIMGNVRIVRVPVPATEPEWIRDWHKDGLIDFDEESKYWMLRAAYYLGECFVRSYPSLRWGIGDPEYIEKNMPVVAGFLSGTEMAPMMIVENLFSRILGDGAPATDIDTAIRAWATDAA